MGLNNLKIRGILKTGVLLQPTKVEFGPAFALAVIDEFSLPVKIKNPTDSREPDSTDPLALLCTLSTRSVTSREEVLLPG